MRICFLLLAWLPLHLSAQPSFFNQLADSAYTLTFDRVTYDPSYFSMPYPNGDVPVTKGVCTDVVIRGKFRRGFTALTF